MVAAMAGRGSSFVRNDVEFVGTLGAGARLEEISVTLDAEYLDEGDLVCVDPVGGREPAGSAIDGVRETLVVDEGEHAGEETLEEIKDVTDGRTEFSVGLEHVAVEDHLPLDPSVRGEEGRCV